MAKKAQQWCVTCIRLSAVSGTPLMLPAHALRRHYAAAASGLGDGCVGWALCCRVPNGNMRCVQSTNHVCGLPLEISYKYLVVVLFS